MDNTALLPQHIIPPTLKTDFATSVEKSTCNLLSQDASILRLVLQTQKSAGNRIFIDLRMLNLVKLSYARNKKVTGYLGLFSSVLAFSKSSIGCNAASKIKWTEQPQVSV